MLEFRWSSVPERARRNQRLEPSSKARRIVDIASDRQASDIRMLDVGKVCSFADYFVIFNSETYRHTDALKQEIAKGLEEEGVRALHIEGSSDSGWVLLDYGDVVVHIFAKAERAYYRLDELWQDATTVVHIQ